MSLTYSDIEALLLAGVSFTADQREFYARCDPETDVVTMREMSGFGHTSLPLEYVVDRAEADAAGSKLEDALALRRMLGELAISSL